ncbi:MAG: hypothetical protein ABW069_12540 [Duganella sp.]
MKNPSSSYLDFRRRMARAALVRFIASVASSLELVLLACAPVLLGLLACIALPSLLAPTLPWCEALGLLIAQTLLVAAPVWLLRKRLHPADVVRWTHALPICPRQRWRAEATVAAMIVGPMALAYAVSCAVWLYQWPDWLRPVAPLALACTVLSLLLGWLLATVALMRRAQPAAPRRVRAVHRAAPAPSDYLPRARGANPLAWLYFWRQLFWLPCWRGDSMVGLQQTCLLVGALLGVAAWLLQPPLLAVAPPAVWGMSTALMLVLLTDRGDKAVAEQIARLRPAVAGWPLSMDTLFRSAIVLALAPGLLVVACFAALVAGRTGPSHTVAGVWLGVAVLAQVAIVALRQLTVRGRVGLVLGAILILTAIGSELWN